MSDKKFRVTATVEITAEDAKAAQDGLVDYIQDGALDLVTFVATEIPRTAFDDVLDKMFGDDEGKKGRRTK